MSSVIAWRARFIGDRNGSADDFWGEYAWEAWVAQLGKALPPGPFPIVDLPPELHPGIDYAAHVLDPDGHVLQLYHEMEQIGWDQRSKTGRGVQTIAQLRCRTSATG